LRGNRGNHDQRLLRELVPAQRLLLVDALGAPASISSSCMGHTGT
jgi:hypothetical protein